jgi:hypothetical protein
MLSIVVMQPCPIRDHVNTRTRENFNKTMQQMYMNYLTRFPLTMHKSLGGNPFTNVAVNIANVVVITGSFILLIP